MLSASSIILSIALSVGLPASLSERVSQPASDVRCEEDMPCWDSATMGQQLPPMSANELDAWDTLQGVPIQPSDPRQILEYVETVDRMPAALPIGYFAVESNTQPQVFHVMGWNILYSV